MGRIAGYCVGGSLMGSGKLSGQYLYASRWAMFKEHPWLFCYCIALTMSRRIFRKR
jgi:hypothetical protein